mgnify:CR=1 FL=1
MKEYRQVVSNQFYKEKVKHITLSSGHNRKTVYCITEKDQLWGWGYNGTHMLGNGSNQSVFEPILLFDGKPVKRIFTTSNGHYGTTFILDGNDELWVTGYTGVGQSSTGSSGTYVKDENGTLGKWGRVKGLNPDIEKNIIDIHFATGSTNEGNRNHTSVYLHYQDKHGFGKLMVCGYNAFGQLGLHHNNEVTTFTSLPYAPRNITRVYPFQNVYERGRLYITDEDDTLWFTGATSWWERGSGQGVHSINSLQRVAGLH